jgi:hypothetical protein
MSDEPVLISIEDAEYFDLLDNIEYKYVKTIIKKGLPIPILIYVSSPDKDEDDVFKYDNAEVQFQIEAKHIDARLDYTKNWEVKRNFMWKSPYGDRVQLIFNKFNAVQDELYKKSQWEHPTGWVICESTGEKIWRCESRKNKIERVIRKIAISKIKRNALYNNGLGLKLAVRAYSKDF